MTTPPPRPRVIERTANHAVGVFEDIVVTYAFRGSVDDPTHVLVTIDALRATAARLKAPVRLMFVVREAGLAKPPSSEVRQAIANGIKKYDGLGLVSQLVVVMVGEGFGAAIHRAVASTVAAIHRPSVPVAVVGDVEAAVAKIAAPGATAHALLHFCRTGLDLTAAPHRTIERE